jgi:predicted O-linked N-acetylglucosamine transferase (SPINDLY family)
MNLLCQGDLLHVYQTLQTTSFQSSEIYHTLSALEFILYGNIETAILMYDQALLLNSTSISPLLYISNHSTTTCCNCNLQDIYFVTIMLIRDLHHEYNNEKLLNGYISLITLTSDYGVLSTENHILQSLRLDPKNQLLQLRSILSIPTIYESSSHLITTRQVLQTRLDEILSRQDILVLLIINEFSLASTFNLVYQGYNDVSFLSSLDSVFRKSNKHFAYSIHPSLIDNDSHKSNAIDKKLKIGFVSSYFRQHSICKFYCGLITHLNTSLFDVYIFSTSSQANEDSTTKAIIARVSKFIRVGKPSFENRYMVTTQQLDVLVYLDIGMDSAMKLWATARMAPVQVILYIAYIYLVYSRCR